MADPHGSLKAYNEQVKITRDLQKRLKKYHGAVNKVLDYFYPAETIANAIPSMDPERYCVYETLMKLKAKAEGKPDPIDEWEKTPEGKKFVDMYGSQKERMGEECINKLIKNGLLKLKQKIHPDP